MIEKLGKIKVGDYWNCIHNLDQNMTRVLVPLSNHAGLTLDCAGSFWYDKCNNIKVYSNKCYTLTWISVIIVIIIVISWVIFSSFRSKRNRDDDDEKYHRESNTIYGVRNDQINLLK